jgi:hypothetical protein
MLDGRLDGDVSDPISLLDHLTIEHLPALWLSPRLAFVGLAAALP